MAANSNGPTPSTVLGSQTVRTIDGVVGVFTPVAVEGAESTPEGQAALQAIIDRLTQEIAALRQANIELQGRIDQLLAPAKSPDDLAAALQRTVDRLQSELASLSNPVSNFAVKDFRLETSLTVAITPLGTLEYRLLQPGSNVDPGSISKLTISLVPIEKQRPDGTFSSLLFQPNKELDLLGMNDGLRQTLAENHIFTIGDFRSAAMRAQVRTLLLASNTTTQEELALLQARAELMLLAGLDRTIADTLLAANIDGLQALARSTPEGLQLILPGVERTQLSQWVTAAQAFTGIEPTDRSRHIVTVRTSPADLFFRMGGSRQFSTTPVAQDLPASQPVTLSTFGSQLKETGTGYVFTGWSTGALTATTTLLTAEDVAAVATFRVACHSVIAATVSPGGMVTLSPSIGGVAGFPAHCYPDGASVEIVVEPERGFDLAGLTITTGGTTRTVTTLMTTLAVHGPVTARAAFVPGRRPL